MRGLEMEIYRTGSFRLTNPIENESKCGVYGPCEYKYEVWIGGNRVILAPPQYFIIDNALIESYFHERYVAIEGIECVSCEVMAMRAVEHFRHIFLHADGYKDRGITSITVRIWGSENAGIKASWRKLRSEKM